MKARTGIFIQRTQGDTDPIIFDLRVSNRGVVSKIPSSANVTMRMETGNTISSFQATSSANGVFSVGIGSANTAGNKVSKFEVIVNDGLQEYVIASGKIDFNNRI